MIFRDLPATHKYLYALHTEDFPLSQKYMYNADIYI